MTDGRTASDVMPAILDGLVEVPGDDDPFWDLFAKSCKVELSSEELFRDAWNYRAESHYTVHTGMYHEATVTFGNIKVKVTSTVDSGGEEIDCSTEYEGPNAKIDLDTFYDFMVDMAYEEIEA